MKVRITAEVMHDDGKRPVRSVRTEYTNLDFTQALNVLKKKTGPLRVTRYGMCQFKRDTAQEFIQAKAGKEERKSANSGAGSDNSRAGNERHRRRHLPVLWPSSERP